MGDNVTKVPSCCVSSDSPEHGGGLVIKTRSLCCGSSSENNTDLLDLSRPLSHYFINSSHNTYLLGNQLTGKVSAEALSTALHQGCRVVELDIYDGKPFSIDGPCVKHGGTPMAPVSLKTCLMAIREAAFATIDTPVIITLDNHTSKDGQRQCAQLLRSILGNALYVPGVACTPAQWPSPRQLLRRFVIRDKAVKIQHMKEYQDEHDDQASDNSDTQSPSRRRVSLQSLVKNNPVKQILASASPRSPTSVSFVPVMVPELLELVALGTVKAGSLQDMESLTQLTSSSFSDSSFRRRLAKDGFDLWRKYTARHIARIYPTWHHIDSSNHDPEDAWEAGCQLAAMNFQGSTLKHVHPTALWLNAGKFRANGACGYVPKPLYMLGPAEPRAAEMNLTVSGGTSWEVFRHAGLLSTPDSYVIVRLAGAKRDRCFKRTHDFKTTECTIFSIHPVWDASFKISDVDLAVLVFSVWDKDSSGRKDDTFLGQNAFPVAELRSCSKDIVLLDARGRDQEGRPTLKCAVEMYFITQVKVRV